jgi:hypothetical protein
MTSQNLKSSPEPQPSSGGQEWLELNRQILAELQALNKGLSFLTQQLDVGHAATMAELSQVRSLVEGFTSGGASFNAYQVDQLTAAYLAIVGPLIAAKLAAPGQPTSLPELMKGAILMGKTLTDELAAYRSQRQGQDYIESITEFTNDPWKNSPT